MRILDWGLIDYRSAVERQESEVEAVASSALDAIILCTHPPIVTYGRATTPDDLKDWTGDRFEVSRGGRATYHGPSQLVIYPILNLQRDRRSFKSRDVHAYLRALENATVKAMHALGLFGAESRTSGAGETLLTGVWVGEKKIASLGIAIRKWVTYHGVAINVAHDPQAFQGIRPCGFAPSVMTSLELELGHTVANVKSVCAEAFSSTLD